MSDQRKAMVRAAYPSDLTCDEWEQVEPLVASVSPSRRGRKRQIDEREIINAILYVMRSGCPWRMLPNDLPSWTTVYYYYNCWKADGTLNQVLATIRR